MSVPKSFMDLFNQLGYGRGGAPKIAASAVLPDDDWTKLEIAGPIINPILTADISANKKILVSDASGSSNPLELDPADPPLALSQPLGSTAYLYAKSSSTASGGRLTILGFSPEAHS